jgi:hypothetical protein
VRCAGARGAGGCRSHHARGRPILSPRAVIRSPKAAFHARGQQTTPEGGRPRKGRGGTQTGINFRPLAWLKKPHGGLRNLVSRGVAAKGGKHAGGGGDARRRLLRAAQRAGVRVCVAGARDGRAVGCCTRRSAKACESGLCMLAVCMRVCSAPRIAGMEEECDGVRAPRAPRPSRAGRSGQCAHRARGGARVGAGGATDRTRHGLLGATPLGLASPMGDLF